MLSGKCSHGHAKLVNLSTNMLNSSQNALLGLALQRHGKSEENLRGRLIETPNKGLKLLLIKGIDIRGLVSASSGTDE